MEKLYMNKIWLIDLVQRVLWAGSVMNVQM